ncbi:hypothetical protein A2U01_0075084, partial [Trifolium medium]|nr:hypothetical protein [Trifolium medium]
ELDHTSPIEETKDTTKEVQDPINDKPLTFEERIPITDGHPLPRQVQKHQEESLGVGGSTRRLIPMIIRLFTSSCSFLLAKYCLF